MTISAGSLDSIAASYTAEIGEWFVFDSEEYLMLVWTAYANDTPPGMYGDEPWKLWGGERIIEMAGITEEQADSGGDRYIDKYGDDVVSQWVKWNK